jgi:hypothetical protein
MDICLPSGKISERKVKESKSISPTNGPHPQDAGVVKISRLSYWQ